MIEPTTAAHGAHTPNGLWVERQGAGAPLVMLHGWGLNLRVFDALAARLGRQREIVRLDLPGHGRSAEPAALAESGWSHAALADLVLEAMPPRATVLGWSLGAQLALEIAARAPARVESLLLVCATPRFAAAADWPAGAAPETLAGFATALARDWRRTTADFLELQVRGSRGADAALGTLRRALETHGACPATVLGRALTLLHQSDLRRRLRAVQSPALVLAGQYDRVVHPAASQALAASLPVAEYAELARCGHAPFLSHEDEFVEKVEAFLARSEGLAA